MTDDCTRKLKDPDADLDYGVKWAPWLAAGDTIASSTWPDPPDGITVMSGGHAPSFTDDTTTVWLAGGTVGVTYRLTNRITTAQGRTDDRTLTVTVQNR